MGIDPIRYDIANADMRNRFYISTGIVASPPLAAEVIVGTLTVTEDVQLDEGVWLDGWVAITIGTSGASLRLRIRQTNISGTVVADTGALTGGIAAGNLVAQDVSGVDTAAVLGGQIYKLTAQIGSGAAASTISALRLTAICV